jgi:hypothetical protein
MKNLPAQDSETLQDKLELVGGRIHGMKWLTFDVENCFDLPRAFGTQKASPGFLKIRTFFPSKSQTYLKGFVPMLCVDLVR